MWQVGTVRVRLDSATRPCGFSTRGAPCPFCREGARPADEHVASVADVIDVVRAAFEEGVADFVFFNSSVYDSEDGGITFLMPYIESVRKHFDTFVAVQVHPPRTNVWIDRTYAMGVDALSYNLELFDPVVLGRHCIGRARYIGRERYLEALAYARACSRRHRLDGPAGVSSRPRRRWRASKRSRGSAWSRSWPSITPGPTRSAGDARRGGEVTRLDGRRASEARGRLGARPGARHHAARRVPFTGTTPPGSSTVQALVRWRLGAYAARGFAASGGARVKAISDSLESSHL
jgi:hypothetical protein